MEQWVKAWGRGLLLGNKKSASNIRCLYHSSRHFRQVISYFLKSKKERKRTKIRKNKVLKQTQNIFEKDSNPVYLFIWDSNVQSDGHILRFEIRSKMRLGKMVITLFKTESWYASIPRQSYQFVSSKNRITWHYLVHLFTYYFSSSCLIHRSKDLVLSRISIELGIDSGTQYIFAEWLIYPYNQTEFFWPLFHNSSFFLDFFFATQSHFANFPETPCLLAVPTTSLLLGLCTHHSLSLGHCFLRQPRVCFLTSFRVLLKQHITKSLLLYFSLWWVLAINRHLYFYVYPHQTVSSMREVCCPYFFTGTVSKYENRAAHSRHSTNFVEWMDGHNLNWYCYEINYLHKTILSLSSLFLKVSIINTKLRWLRQWHSMFSLTAVQQKVLHLDSSD